MLASSQQFCVKWNSYSSNLQNVFPRLLTSEHFVDITLACEGQMIKCHKVVLSACSTYFEKLLVQNPCQHPIIFMKDMKHWEVQALVDFMYKGEVNVSQDELNSLLVAAEALQIRGLCGSEQANVGKQQKVPRQQTGENKFPTVSLPHDTVLSGRESPPFKRRKTITEDLEQSSSKAGSTVSPAFNNRSSLVSTSSSLEVNSLPLAAPSSHSTTSETDVYADHVENKKSIKQEVIVDDNYFEGEVEADGPEEEYSLEHQDDSDSNNREDVLPASPIDQPGPSGLTSGPGIAMDKTTTGWEDVQTGVLHLLYWTPGQVNKVRRRCTGCYQKLKQTKGKRVAYNRAKRVITYCVGCRRAPAMCLPCFEETHAQSVNLRIICQDSIPNYVSGKQLNMMDHPQMFCS
ncbi:protein bric-a-brac 2-like isoform X3 [Periplaneta americana]|uniref:protein bric-a-brac 2-like isoform X3 n=1 Tax=Periplaneta americana TaxID=6978 RepID=UPI0037E78BB4